MDKSRKSNWTREEECSLNNEIESAGEILRGSGNFASKTRGGNKSGETLQPNSTRYMAMAEL